MAGSNSEQRVPQLPESPASAGVAGVGGGTLVAALATSLPENHALKPVLLIASPSVAICVRGIWLWMNARLSNWLRDREAKSILSTARIAVQKALDNSHTSEEYKKSVQAKLEEMEHAVLDRMLRRLRSLKVCTEEDAPPDPK